MHLCLERGYERTTVDQIAAAADVSPRTFSRYFATKDAVLLTLLEDFADAVAGDLAGLPRDVVLRPVEDLVDDLDGQPLGPDLMADRIVESFGRFVGITSDLTRG